MAAPDDDATLSGSLALGDTHAKAEHVPARAVLGNTLGRHLLLSELGAGAMGVVFAAYDPQLDRKIAIKLVRGHANEAARTRMQREAQALAKLGHPNVVAVYDVGVHDEQLFIAMEFVEGQTLRAWMDAAPAHSTSSRGPARASPLAPVRPWREVLDVFAQAGRGLAAAHAAGLVHRDFKPDNVMLSKDGRVRVMDFGLARAGEGAQAWPPSRELGSPTQTGAILTQTGAVLGTPAYMSLEQFGGGSVDARSDQFSFCVALHEALYGERPFAAQTLGELTGKLMAGVVPPPPARTSVPSWVRAVVVRGLAGEPSQRFASMDELLRALASDPVARRRRAAATFLAAAGLGLGVGLSVTLLDEVEERDAVIEERDAVIEEQAGELERKNATLEQQVAEQTRLLSIQRGLRAISLIEGPHEAEALLLGIQAVGAYADDWRAAPREAVMGLEQVLAHDTVNLQASHVLSGHTDYVTSVAYSPDGSLLASTGFDGSVRVWDVERAALRDTFTRPGATRFLSLAFSPDGSRLAAMSEHATIWALARGEIVATLPGPLHTLAFSPDGQSIAAIGFSPRVGVWDAATGAPRWTSAGASELEVADLAYTPDGTRLITADGAALRVWDAASGTLLATRVGHEARILSLAIAPDGAQLVSGGEDQRARLWSLSKGELDETPLVLDAHRDRIREVAYEPAGRRVVTASWDGSAMVFDAASGARLATLAGAHTAGIVSLVLSHDGSTIATGSYDGNAALWSSETWHLRARLRGHRADVWSLAFAPDDGQLASGSVDHSVRSWDLDSDWVVALAGPETDSHAFAYSPDETRLATLSNGGRVRVWSSATGVLQRTFEVGKVEHQGYLAFAPDGRRLAVATHGSTQVWDVQTGARLWTTPTRQAVVKYAPAGTLIFVHDTKAMHVYDADDFALLATLSDGEPHERESFAPDDSRLAIATKTAPVQLFDPRSGALLGLLGTAKDTIGNVLHSPNGDELATSGGQAIVLWDAQTLTARLTLPDSSDVAELAYSPDGRHLAGSRGRDGVWVWDTSEGELVVHIEPEAYDTGTGTLSFTPDGERLVIAGSGVRMHEVASGTLLRSIDSLLEQPPHVSRDGTRLTLVDTEARLEVWDLESGELATRERVGVRRSDGTVAWPLPTPELVRIGCTRLRVFTTAYPLVRALCERIVGG